jgi:tRNA(fMet)-specific endonuclease VapC
VSYVLDANVCIALINDRPASVRERFASALARHAALYISSITAHELWYGVAKSTRQPQNAEKLRRLLTERTAALDFDADDARAAGTIRAALESRGKPIGPYDVLLAGQALRRGLTLVTANVSEFARVPGLAWENWASASR